MTSDYDQHNITNHTNFSYLITGGGSHMRKKRPIRSKSLVKHVNLTNHKEELYV